MDISINNLTHKFVGVIVGIFFVVLLGLMACDPIHEKISQTADNSPLEIKTKKVFPKDLMQARETYLDAFANYTRQVTEGGDGNISELLDNYQKTYTQYKVLLKKYNYEDADLAEAEYSESEDFSEIDGIEDLADNNVPLQIESEMDVKKAEQTAEEVEKAFANADLQAILGFMSEIAIVRSKEDIEKVGEKRLKEFARDFNRRRILGYGDDFIEFEFDWNGIPYTVDFALQEDGTFKILRL